MIRVEPIDLALGVGYAMVVLGLVLMIVLVGVL